jgi:hypothetical protein
MPPVPTFRSHVRPFLSTSAAAAIVEHVRELHGELPPVGEYPLEAGAVEDRHEIARERAHASSLVEGQHEDREQEREYVATLEERAGLRVWRTNDRGRKTKDGG